jgi:hypothetical protein
MKIHLIELWGTERIFFSFEDALILTHKIGDNACLVRTNSWHLLTEKENSAQEINLLEFMLRVPDFNTIKYNLICDKKEHCLLREQCFGGGFYTADLFEELKKYYLGDDHI